MNCECMAKNKAEMTYEQLNAANNSACNNLAICKEKLFNRRSEVTLLSRQLAEAVKVLETLADQGSHFPGSTDKIDCMATKARNALKLIRDIGEGKV
jgi:hypothetical protein